MHRVIAQRFAEPVEAALALLPEPILELVQGFEILTGVDPVFAGLHRYTEASYGRSYADTAHVAYPFHQLHKPVGQRVTTMVLPLVPDVRTVVHELGHVLHERLRFEPNVRPVTWYAKTDPGEAFAEAFAAWALPFGHSYGKVKERLYTEDRATVALFERLADGRRY